MSREPKAPMTPDERYQFARGILALTQRSLAAATELATIAGQWIASDPIRFGTSVDHREAGKQHLDMVIVSSADMRTDVTEKLAEIVSPLRIAHDRLAAAKRRIPLDVTFPFPDHPWPVIRALDNLQKHQEAPSLRWATENVDVLVYTGDRRRQIGVLEASVAPIPLPVVRTGADHIRVVTNIPKKFRGPDFAYGIRIKGAQLIIGGTREHPIDYPLRPLLFALLDAAKPLVGLAEGSFTPTRENDERPPT